MNPNRFAHVEEIQEWLRGHLFDQVPIAISIIDRNYNIVDANPRFEKSYGQWRGRPCYEVYKDRTEPCLNCAAANRAVSPRLLRTPMAAVVSSIL